MKLKLRYKGIFDHKDLLNKLDKYFNSKQFIYNEIQHKDKGKEIKVKTTFFQETTEYFKIDGSVYMVVWDPKPVDVNGKIMESGRFEITMKADIIKDYKSRFKSETGKKIKPLFEGLKKKDVEVLEKYLADIVGGAYAMLKKEVKMDI